MDTTMNHTHRVIIVYRPDDIPHAVVASVMAAAVDPLVGAVAVEDKAHTHGDTTLVTVEARYFGANDNEALRTAKVMAAAIGPLTRGVHVPTAGDVHRTEEAPMPR